MNFNPFCPKPKPDPSTVQLLTEINSKLDKLMSTETDLIAAATTLSTAADALSVKVGTLITTIDTAVAALQNENLSPAGQDALNKLQASAVTASATSANVDAEVTKLDGVLPTPAPAAPAA